MPEQNEPPRPHGDPLEREIVEPNPAQRFSDAPESEDVVGQQPGGEEPAAPDEADGAARRKRYDDGAELVSKID